MLADERQAVVDHLDDVARLTPGRTGNVSVRRGDRFAVTPSGVSYAAIDAADVPVVTEEGEQVAGEFAPSSEMPMHRGIYQRFDAGAVAHVHSPWATTLAVLRESLPPVHYMIVLAGEQVPVADYATYGTEQLADNVVTAMEAADSEACILANHGLVATGEDAASAVETAQAVESVARVYCQARAFGTPETLSPAELQHVAERFEDYGPDGES